MPGLFSAVLAGILLLVVVALWQGYRRLKRAQFIRTYTLPVGLYDKLRERRPELSYKDCALVSRGLRQFFLAYVLSGRKFVAMPSQVADELWHEFILYTRHYEQFCRKAFGGFLHHTPAVVLGPEKHSNEGLRRVWWYACAEENVDPKKPVRLPLLFALDAKFGIPNGFRYGLGKAAQAGAVAVGVTYSTEAFSDISIDGSLDGFGDGDGGGDGGGGCGGD